MENYFPSEILGKINNDHEDLRDILIALDNTFIIAITDDKGIIKYVNNKFCEISKYTRDELINQNHRILNSGFHSKEFFKRMWKTIGLGKTWTSEIRNKAKDGSVYWVHTTIVPFMNENKKPYQYVAFRVDITESKELAELAYYDVLTRLPNRRYLNRYFKKLINGKEKNCAVCFIDIDGFKEVNDTFGHETGDFLLQKVAKRLDGTVRENGMLSRIGGDEFVIVIEDCDKEEVSQIAQRIIGEFSIPFILNEHSVFVSPSIGISLFPNDGENLAELINKADDAMYQVKKQGKNNYQFYEVIN